MITDLTGHMEELWTGHIHAIYAGPNPGYCNNIRVQPLTVYDTGYHNPQFVTVEIIYKISEWQIHTYTRA